MTPLRCARFASSDPLSGRVLIFLTNHFDLPALSIAKLYKLRWQVELFFKWINDIVTLGAQGRITEKMELVFRHRSLVVLQRHA